MQFLRIEWSYNTLCHGSIHIIIFFSFTQFDDKLAIKTESPTRQDDYKYHHHGRPHRNQYPGRSQQFRGRTSSRPSLQSSSRNIRSSTQTQQVVEMERRCINRNRREPTTFNKVLGAKQKSLYPIWLGKLQQKRVSVHRLRLRSYRG